MNAGTAPTPEGQRVLIAAPFGRDAQSVAKLLQQAGHETVICGDLRELGAQIDVQTGAVLLTQEALVGNMAALNQALDQQPPWSDVPFILLIAASAGRSGRVETARLQFLELATNCVILERPIGKGSLTSAVASALRLRRKQFEMRDRLVELRESDRRFKAITNSIDQMIWTTLPDGLHDYFNDRWYEFTGMAPGATDGDGWNAVFHPDDRERAWQRWRASLATGQPYEIEYRLRHHSGTYRWVLGRAQAQRDEEGHIVRWFGTCTEIQDLVEAREVLSRSREELEQLVAARTAALEAEMASRSEVEAALRQSQKMEAVGQLTGGIAHDFNNMLAGVIAGLDLIKLRIDSGRFDGVERFMEASIASAQRAASLTARLLAFSRKQSLDARPLDINALVVSLEDLFRRTLTESIRLRVVPGKNLSLVVADSNQLESALLNLAINARDAMPQGGELTVETSMVELDEAHVAAEPGMQAGRYVAIAVSDTGVGISEDMLEKVFEPFYTTKPIGQGTGLGLSMIYGFARQSGGRVRIHSQPGQGTTVSLHLPANDAASLEQTPPAVGRVREGKGKGKGKGQSVLLIEDDPSVRMMVRELLNELQYEVHEAPNADAALPILTSDCAIDLMLSDVGLPGMNGRQLAEIARHHRPALPILFLTGYAENAAHRPDFLGNGMAMMTKPFSLETLAGKIDEMIASTTSAHSAPAL
ncbi:PAS domain-containing hybrid sensor histidine kinase/response regulator [Rhodanobacter ginsenosidimutans]|uniref:histidine kinase n=1 Tax=Rhodanobacter ginsenosidimutans TaxID=490571 RepID=A0ABW0JRT8_9GAMM